MCQGQSPVLTSRSADCVRLSYGHVFKDIRTCSVISFPGRTLCLAQSQKEDPLLLQAVMARPHVFGAWLSPGTAPWYSTSGWHQTVHHSCGRC